MSPEDEIKDQQQMNDSELIENIEFPDVILPNGPSDSDDLEEEQENPDGYVLLCQEPGDLAVATASDSEDETLESDTPVSSISNQSWRISGPAASHQPHLSHYPEGMAPSYLQDLPRPEKKDVLWNQSTETSQAIKMDEEHAAEIKAAMSGFQLPISHVPEWAKNVSEDQWKEKFISQILSPKEQTSHFHQS